MYDDSMIPGPGPTLIKLDRYASEPEKPYGIITADCSSPHEFDDGIAVQPLPSAHELYQVSVFAADTSALYFDESIAKAVLTATESRYYDPQDGRKIYEPMLSRQVIDKHHFVQGSIRKALVVSFLVGAAQPPSEPAISFGKVEVLKNYTYNRFGEKCRYSQDFQSFGRAAALILGYLNTTVCDEEDTYRGLIHVPKSETWKRGANINQAYMVAANHLVARLMKAEDRLAIYRTHDSGDANLAEIMSPRVAHYSVHPAPHDGLGLDIYSRVTSPLRRAEDFMMHGLLKARQDGRSLTPRDHKLVAATVQRLNQRVAASLFHDPPLMEKEDLPLQLRHQAEIAS